MRTVFSPEVRAWLGIVVMVGAWLEHRFNERAANWYRGFARALLGPPVDGNAEELMRSYSWVRTEVVLLGAAGAGLLLSGLVSLLV